MRRFRALAVPGLLFAWYFLTVSQDVEVNKIGGFSTQARCNTARADAQAFGATVSVCRED